MSAKATLQAYLDTVSKAVMEDDFDTFLAHVALPFQLVTEVTTLVVTSPDDLEAGFDNFVSLLATHKVTDYIRIANAAVELHGALISGRYTTHMLANGQRVLPQFSSQITLRRDGDLWRAVTIAHPSKNARWPLITLDIHD